MYRVTSETIDDLKDEGYDVWTISLWEQWLEKMPELTLAIDAIRNAFHGVTLGDGLGLQEANSIDNYSGDAEREAARVLDEKIHWQNIDAALLNQCYVATSYFDAKGFLFHLPAFLIAELADEFQFGYIDRLIEKQPLSTEWIGLLDNAQATAIVDTLGLVKSHPDYYNHADTIEKAIERISNRSL